MSSSTSCYSTLQKTASKRPRRHTGLSPKWLGKSTRVGGCTLIGTMTRTAIQRLKRGATVDDIPHKLQIAGQMALVVVPGRVPSVHAATGRVGSHSKRVSSPQIHAVPANVSATRAPDAFGRTPWLRTLQYATTSK